MILNSRQPIHRMDLGFPIMGPENKRIIQCCQIMSKAGMARSGEGEDKGLSTHQI